MAATSLAIISVPMYGVAALSFSNIKPLSKRSFTRNINGTRTRRTITTAAFQVTLITPKGDKVLHVSEDESILDAAEKQGIDVPHLCRSGACSSCVALLKSGTLNQDDQSYLNEAQLEAGFALLCTAYPTSDCVIQTHQEELFY